MRCRFRFPLVIMLLPMWSSCALLHHKKVAKAVPVQPRLVGTISVVNEAMSFVLIDVGASFAPTPGTALKSFAGDTESGILAVSPERRRPFITADIVKGAPHQGDLVFQ